MLPARHAPLLVLAISSLALCPISRAQQPTASNVHTVFLVNGGVDKDFASRTHKPPATLYNSVYAALQSLPDFHLVDDIAKADLVLSVKGVGTTSAFVEPPLTDDRRTCDPNLNYGGSCSPSTSYFDESIATLQALSVRTGMVPWTQSINLRRRHLGVEQAAFDLVNTMLAEDKHTPLSLKKPSHWATPPSAPVPALLRTCTTAAVPLNPNDSTTAFLLPAAPLLDRSLTAWGHYNIVHSSADSHLLFRLRTGVDGSTTTLDTTLTPLRNTSYFRVEPATSSTPDQILTLEAVDSQTDITLWAVSVPFTRSPYNEKNQKSLDRAVNGLVTDFRNSVVF